MQCFNSGLLRSSAKMEFMCKRFMEERGVERLIREEAGAGRDLQTLMQVWHLWRWVEGLSVHTSEKVLARLVGSRRAETDHRRIPRGWAGMAWLQNTLPCSVILWAQTEGGVALVGKLRWVKGVTGMGYPPTILLALSMFAKIYVSDTWLLP